MKQYKIIIKKYWLDFFRVGLLSILSSFVMVIAGYSLSFLYIAYEYQNPVKALIITFGIVILIWLIAMAIYALSLIIKYKTQQKLMNELRYQIGNKISRLSYVDLMKKDSGHYVSWLTHDVNELYNQTFSSLFSGIESLATSIFSFVALCMLSFYIGLVAIVLLIMISIVPQIMNKKLQIVASSSKAEEVCYQFNKTNSKAQISISTVSMIGQVILLLVTLLLAAKGASFAGAALSVGNLAGSFFNSISDLSQSFMSLKASKPLWEKFIDEIDYIEDKKHLPDISEIKFENVSFQYGNQPLLRNENITFGRKGKYTLMGESGSGKTTIAKIILGLLPDYTGQVWYGKNEQRDIYIEDLYQQIAYVDQQVYLFQDTVRFNITLGVSYSEEEILSVIRKCSLEDFLIGLPDGLDTMIMENGKNLSGGQRQRIALARALIRKVHYIILDEGTSALDEANALEVENHLFNMPELSVILITHHLRESIRQKCDAVYVLE